MNVFQIYLSDNEDIPLPKELIEKSVVTQRIFNGYKYKLFTNTSLHEFIKENYSSDVLDAYNMLLPYSYKSDLGRFCVLNKLGGWYLDLTITPRVTLNLPSDIEMVVFRDIQRHSHNNSSCITGLFFSVPNNPVLDLAISTIVNNCKTRFYGITPLCPTGPVVFGNSLCKVGNTSRIIYGDTKFLTPEYSIKNLAFVLDTGSIFAFGKEPGIQLTDIGCKGTNNYSEMWLNKIIYANETYTKKITDIPVVFISPDNNEKYFKRRKDTETLLQKIGFTSISHYKSSNEGYPRCLSKANIDILSERLDDQPVLIVEDDIGFTGITDITIPTDADCIYVGFSIHSGSNDQNTNTGSCQVKFLQKGLYKICNMLSAHGIIYITKRFKEASIKAFQEAYEKGNHMDVLLSRILSKYNVYANSKPVFYQNDETNIENSRATMIQFGENPVEIISFPNPY